MRLIDAEKFEAFDATCHITKGMRSGKTAAYFYGEGCRKVLEAIDAAPTIDPESLRPTGKWELHGNDDDMASSYWCSNCNAQYAEDMFYPDGYVNGHWQEKPFKYCPCCGARMVYYDD